MSCGGQLDLILNIGGQDIVKKHVKGPPSHHQPQEEWTSRIKPTPCNMHDTTFQLLNQLAFVAFLSFSFKFGMFTGCKQLMDITTVRNHNCTRILQLTLHMLHHWRITYSTDCV